MKVLKKGNGQKSWSTKRTCSGHGNGGGGCGATLLVEKPDLYKTSSHHYDGSSEYYITFSCPLCKVETDLPKNASLPFYDQIPSKKRLNKVEGEK